MLYCAQINRASSKVYKSRLFHHPLRIVLIARREAGRLDKKNI